MKGWQIKLPYAFRDQTPSEALAAGAQDALEDREDRAVAARLLLAAVASPDIQTVGDLLDLLDYASPEERRELLDRSRESAGLSSASRVEADQALDARLTAPTSRDAYGRVEHRCAEHGCNVIETDERLGVGSAKWSKIRGPWRCHEHRAGYEEAFEPWEPRGLAVNPRTGGLVDLEEQERERERAEREAEARQKRHERRLAERRAEAEQLRPFEEARDEQLRREHPEGLRP